MNIDKSTQTKLQQQARFLRFCSYLLWLLSLLLFLLLFPLTSKAWTTEQKQLAGIATTLMVVDWAQTRHIANNPHKFHELNPLLPNHPSIGQVNRHFIISGLIIGTLAHNLPQYRNLLLKTYIGYQTINTIRNYHIGIKLDF